MAGQALSIRERAGQLIDMVDQRAADFADSLGTLVPSEKFVRIIKTAIMTRPAIARCDPLLVILECQKAAADGLVIDGRYATLTVYKTKQKVNGKDEWIEVPKYIPMFQGLLSCARRSGEMKSIGAYIVHKADLDTINPRTGQPHFHRWMDDDGEHIMHEPVIAADPGPMVAVYTIAKLRSGIVDRCFMTAAEVLKIKARTKSKDSSGNVIGPWKDDEPEMWKKTCFRRHSKTLDLDSNLARAFERDDDLYEQESERRPARPKLPTGGAAARLNRLPPPDDPEDDEDQDGREEEMRGERAPIEVTSEPKGRQGKAAAKPQQQDNRRDDPPPPGDEDGYAGDAF